MLKPFFVRQKKVLRRINPADVIGLESVGNYTKIFLRDKTHCMVRATLTGALKKLPPDMFVKVHRSAVVSVYHIDRIHKDHLEIGPATVPIAKQYYKSFIKELVIIS